jgi:ABC-type lipoprotein release transport system permease subunit
LGVLLGTILAAAVLTGSLLVGDSVDGSLRRFALQRLGTIRYAMHTPNRFFSSGLAGKVSNNAAAVLQLRGMAMTDEKQVNRVQVLGADPRFWTFAGLDFELQKNEVALNVKLASVLGVEVGDEVSLRVEKPGLLPLDAPLASQKADQTVRGRFVVRRILGDDELGRFSLSANQVVPYNAFVNHRVLEERTGLNMKANLLVAGSRVSMEWDCIDFGLRFRAEDSVVQLESDQIYLEPEAARAAMAVPEGVGTLTYLVNSVSKGRQSTPYSFVIAKDGEGLRDDEISINRWLANELDAGIGDTVSMKYFELLPSNRFEERERQFTVRGIVEMNELETERKLAPNFPGLTDVDRCADWDVGIPMEEEKLADEANEAYWNEYNQTPKAMVSLKAGQDMWANRFGRLTSVRWSEGERIEAAFRAEFDPAAAGFIFLPVHEQALAAVDNAMDFGGLFVGMSFFLIVAALLLTGLLFIFGIQQRAEEMGVLLATGWSPRRVRGLFLAEGGAIALIGAIAGAWIGTGYTQLLIFGLSRYWGGAVAHSAIRYFAEPETVVKGAVLSFGCAVVAMGMAAWRQAKHPARELLLADFSQPPSSGLRRVRGIRLYTALACGSGAAGIVVYALVGDTQSVTMPFFGAGALLLLSGVLFCGEALQRVGRQECLPLIFGMALRNVARRRGRSLTVIGLLACGCFLVFAVSSMKEDVAAHADEPWSGTGGFKWFGESVLPISEDLGGVRLRVRDGDDASCLNLNRAQAPRLLGVDPDAMSTRKAFVTGEDFWPLLKQELPDGVVPALVGDSDTAMWGLEAMTGMEKGDVLTYRNEAGRAFQVKLVGRLPMRLSVFQGTILIAENRFVQAFPREEGYRMFLLNEPVESRRYEKAGLDVVPATDRLLEFYAVEATYLAMFLVLGVLGLAVGSMGMGVVVLRNMQDRRTETALLRAVGYRGRVLWKLLFFEHGLLLAAGLGVGVLASAVAMVPTLLVSKSQVSAGFLIGLLAAVAGCGFVCMVAAIHGSLRGDVLRGLRNE